MISGKSTAVSEALAARLHEQYPDLETRTRVDDPDGFDIVVNATRWGCARATPCRWTSTGSDPARLSVRSS